MEDLLLNYVKSNGPLGPWTLGVVGALLLAYKFLIPAWLRREDRKLERITQQHEVELVRKRAEVTKLEKEIAMVEETTRAVREAIPNALQGLSHGIAEIRNDQERIEKKIDRALGSRDKADSVPPAVSPATSHVK